MMNLGIIALIFFTMVGSLMWVMPNKAEKRLASIRTYGISKGLRITSIKAPDLSLEGRIDGKFKLYTAYKKGMPRKKGAAEYVVLRTTGESGYGLIDGWRFEEPSFRLQGTDLVRLNEALERLPAWTDLLAILPDGIAIGFDERGGNDQVDAVCDLLDEFSRQFFVK